MEVLDRRERLRMEAEILRRGVVNQGLGKPQHSRRDEIVQQRFSGQEFLEIHFFPPLP